MHVLRLHLCTPDSTNCRLTDELSVTLDTCAEGSGHSGRFEKSRSLASQGSRDSGGWGALPSNVNNTAQECAFKRLRYIRRQKATETQEAAVSSETSTALTAVCDL